MSIIHKQNKPKRVGILIAGLLGNNGSTLWCLHKLCSEKPILGSIIESADLPLRFESSRINLSTKLKSVNLISKLSDIIVIDGWDAYDNVCLKDALEKNKIVPKKTLQHLLRSNPEELTQPIKKGIIYPEFIGLGLQPHSVGNTKQNIQRIRRDIDAFATLHSLDYVIVMYSGCTERKANNSTCQEDFDCLIDFDCRESKHHKGEISPSQIYALAAATSKITAGFINCAAQDTLIPCIQKIFQDRNRYAIGNDLQTGQTRLKSALLGTFLGCGIPVETIMNTNHLGNSDGFNLQNMETNRSKTQSKCAMVSSAMASCPTLYQQNYEINQLVQISYMPGVGDNKRAMDEYIMELPFDHKLDIFINSINPDTSLAMGVMVDLILSLSVIQSTSILHFDEEYPITNNQANALVACLVKNPQTNINRFSFHENRDVLTGFLLEACYEAPETSRHKLMFQNKR